MARALGLLLIAVLALGCSQAALEGLAAGLAAAGAAQPYAAPRSGKLMIFGGRNHQIYLGCLSCSEFESDSVFNRYGTFGSAYSAESIFNKHGDFGSRYSIFSACNPYASDPPVIVDSAGNFYGRLTVNRYHSQRTNSDRIANWIAAVCGSQGRGSGSQLPPDGSTSRVVKARLLIMGDALLWPGS